MGAFFNVIFNLLAALKRAISEAAREIILHIPAYSYTTAWLSELLLDSHISVLTRRIPSLNGTFCHFIDGKRPIADAWHGLALDM